MIKDGGVRIEGCICEPYSDIMPNWKDMRTKFGYTDVIRHCPLYSRMTYNITGGKNGAKAIT